MQETITMSGKGQIVIPARVRKRFGLKKGEKLILEVEDRDIKLTPKTVDLTTLVGSWPELDTETITKEIIEDRERDAKIEKERENQIEKTFSFSKITPIMS